jgi:YfiH family protein
MSASAPVKLSPPFYWWAEHLAIDLPGARAVFTTRRGGYSRGAFASLNLGRLTGDDPDAVARNRELLQSRLPARLAMIRQVHGSCVLRPAAVEAVSGPAPQGELEEADGQATATGGIAPLVLTADCLPIAVAGGGAAAILHAGWRGLAEGIIERGVQAVRELGGTTGQLVAAIGPGAGSCCYEVGEEVHQRFSGHAAARRGDKLDLKAVAAERLEAAGVSTVHDAGLCTICTPSWLFFSHRRDQGRTGRQAGIVWLTGRESLG